MKRIPSRILSKFPPKYKKGGSIWSLAPGRINIIGEHTDYNRGQVLPAAINRYAYFSFIPRPDEVYSITALDLNEETHGNHKALEKSDKDWANFLIGNLLQFQQNEVELQGFDCAFTSEVPVGAGMSSSSAIECGFLIGLQQMFQTNFDLWKLIHMSQRSNHEFLGVKGGILDQFASFHGQADKFIHLDCDTLNYKYYEWSSSEYIWLVINSCVKHSHLTSGYNDRAEECARALISVKELFPDTKHLSDYLDKEKLKQVHFENDNHRKRALYIIEENARVKAFIAALELKNYMECGSLLYDSHEGMSIKYEISCPELDFLVETLQGQPGVIGARMMGGGFGGCTINLVSQAEVPVIKAYLSPLYKQNFGFEPLYYDLKISDGALAYTKPI